MSDERERWPFVGGGVCPPPQPRSVVVASLLPGPLARLVQHSHGTKAFHCASSAGRPIDRCGVLSSDLRLVVQPDVQPCKAALDQLVTVRGLAFERHVGEAAGKGGQSDLSLSTSELGARTVVCAHTEGQRPVRGPVWPEYVRFIVMGRVAIGSGNRSAALRSRRLPRPPRRIPRAGSVPRYPRFPPHVRIRSWQTQCRMSEHD
jgi:hypothetical protein